MSALTALVEKNNLPVSLFSAEIEKTGDRTAFPWRDAVSDYLGEVGYGGYDGITDVKLIGAKKLFLWTHNQQNGSDAMDYWWSIQELVDGRWKTLYERRYTGYDRYNSDRYTSTFADAEKIAPASIFENPA